MHSTRQNYFHTLLISLSILIFLASESVSVAMVQESQITTQDAQILVATGVMKSARTTMLGPVVPGVIEHTFVKVGDFVVAGEALFQVRKVDYEIAVRKTEAQLALANARHVQQRQEFERVSKLFSTKTISQSRLDDAKANLDISQAQKDLAQSNLEGAEQALADTTVKAPYDGVITRKMTNEGAYKSVQAFSGSGGVMEIQESKLMVAILFVPAHYVSQLRRGQKATLTIDGIAQQFSSEILVINHQIQANTNMIEIRVPVRSEDLLIKDGQTVVAKIQLSEKVTK